jgi:hypothetical protein
MKTKAPELNERERLIHYIVNRQAQIKEQEKTCKYTQNKTDLIKLQSKQIQLFSLLKVLETLGED